MNRIVWKLRDHCVICRSSELTPVTTIPQAPIFQGCVLPEQRIQPEKFDMDWWSCEDCGAAQIRTMPNFDLVYQRGHAAGFGKVWAQHHDQFSQFIQKNIKGTNVLEIGGGAGQLALCARRNGISIPWTILEPNPFHVVDELINVEYNIGFVDKTFVNTTFADTFVISHVLEHMYEPTDVIDAFARELKKGQQIFLAWPILENWCEELLAGSLNFEHNYFITEKALINLFARAGFHLKAIEPFPNLKTSFMCFEKTHSITDLPMINSSGKSVLSRYYRRFSRLSEELQNAIDVKHHECFLTPASVYSQTLFSFYLNPRSFQGFLDNSKTKQGKILSGFDLPIYDPTSVLPKIHSPQVIINAGAHTDEIIQQFLLLNSRIRFVDARNFVANL